MQDNAIKQSISFKDWLSLNPCNEYLLEYQGDIKDNPIFRVRPLNCNEKTEIEITIFESTIAVREV